MSKDLSRRSVLFGVFAACLPSAVFAGKLPGLDDATPAPKSKPKKPKAKTKSSPKSGMNDSKRFTRLRQLRRKLRTLERTHEQALVDESYFAGIRNTRNEEAEFWNDERARLLRQISTKQKKSNDLTKRLRRGRNPDGSRMTRQQKDDLVRQINPLNKSIRADVKKEKQYKETVKRRRRAASKAQVKTSKNGKLAEQAQRDIKKIKAEIRALE